MPTFLAINENVQYGTAVFNNTQQVTIVFPKPFAMIPSVSITLNDQSGDVPYKLDVTTTQATIRFKRKWTGTIDYTAIARG